MGSSDESICDSMQRQYPEGEVQEFINALKPKAKPKATKKAAVKSK